jgi:putative ABC transport system ATP-binding protein
VCSSDLEARAMQQLERVRIAEQAGKYPLQLSGGQQQRVAIARAMVTQPQVLLADEPTGNLDTHRSHEIMALIQRLNRQQGITVLMVTHENDIAAYAQRTVRFVDGRIAKETHVV